MKFENTNQLRSIVSQFAIDSDVAIVTPFGDGLINDTYLVTSGQGKRYILQHVNRNIFSDIEVLQHNLHLITTHIRQCLKNKCVSDIERKVLKPVSAKDGKLWVEADGEAWRMTHFIEGSNTYNTLTPAMAVLTGKAFAEFQGYFAVEEAPAIKPVIENFHNVGYRVQQLKAALEANTAERLDTCRQEVDLLLAQADDMMLAERMHASGELPLRITHCDTKLNNILFDENGEILCVIDLDTTMPGFVLSDFGDFIRTAANKGDEDDKDLSRVEVDMEIFRNFATGYLAHAHFLTPVERRLLPFGAKMLTYMQAVRFLTDYLNGDTYYKTKYADHNLVRTRAQIKLLSSIEHNFADMESFIRSLPQ